MAKVKTIDRQRWETNVTAALGRQQHEIRALEEAICPRVAARLTVLERSREIQIQDGDAVSKLFDDMGRRIVALEWCIEDAKKRAKPAPSEAELWNTTWTAATALSQEQLGRMIQSLQRVYWKKRLATEK